MKAGLHLVGRGAWPAPTNWAGEATELWPPRPWPAWGGDAEQITRLLIEWGDRASVLAATNQDGCLKTRGWGCWTKTKGKDQRR